VVCQTAITDVGMVSFVCNTSGWESQRPSGSGQLAHVTLRTVAEGLSPLDLSGVILVDPPGEYITAGVADGSVSVVDGDLDGVPDAQDNCPTVYNPDQANTDRHRRPNGADVPGNWASNPVSDTLGDACDPDSDNDWMLDSDYNTFFPTPIPPESVGCNDSGPTYDLQRIDSDADTVIDGAECALGSNPNNAGSKPPGFPPPDGDHDKLPAWLDNLLCPTDVDGDTLAGDNDPDCDFYDPSGSNAEFIDGVEFRGYGLKPAVVDSDADGCADWIEIVDVNGSRQANISDVYLVAMRANGLLGAESGTWCDNNIDDDSDGRVNDGCPEQTPAPETGSQCDNDIDDDGDGKVNDGCPLATDPASDYVLDIDKDGDIDTADAYLAAKNSSLVKPHSTCASEG